MSYDPERRRVLSSLALLMGMGLVASNAQCESKKGHVTGGRSKVARARRADVIEVTSGAVNLGTLRGLLGKAVAAAMGYRPTRNGVSASFSAQRRRGDQGKHARGGWLVITPTSRDALDGMASGRGCARKQHRGLGSQ